MAAHEGSILNFHIVAGAAPFQECMLIPRGDQGASPYDRIVILGFFDGYPANTVESVCEGTVKCSGICWTMTIPGESSGRASRNTFSASVPPVEAPDNHHFLRSGHHSPVHLFGDNRVCGKLGLHVGEV